MQTQPNPQEKSQVDVVVLALQETDQVGGGMIASYTGSTGAVYYRDSWTGRIGVDDPVTGTCHWL